MGRIKMMGLRLPTADLRIAKPPEKVAASIYSTPEFRAWREAVIAKAGRRCEATERGRRCDKAEPYNRMFADHIIELSDGGAPYDVLNGQCLCGGHHTKKTNEARAARAVRLSQQS